jgi:hypothetical protein
MSVSGFDRARKSTALHGLPEGMPGALRSPAAGGPHLRREATIAPSGVPARTREDDEGRPPRGKRERFHGHDRWKARAGAGFGSRKNPAGSGGSAEIDRLRADICGEAASCLAAAFSTAPPAPFP